MCLHRSADLPPETGAPGQLALKPLSAALQVDASTLPVAARSGSRRRKLWELNHRSHCPVIGSCLPMAELRRLAKRAGLNARTTSDYSLHVYAVGQAQERGEFAELMQRELERRYATAVARFASVHDAATLLARWRETAAAGDVAGALWAALTHPACDETSDKEIYGEIHMLSHQVGAGHRADLKRLAELEAELARSAGEARRDRERAQRRQSELELQLRVRDAQLAEARCTASEHEAVRRRLEAQDDALQRARGVETEWRRRAEAAERKLEAQRGERVGLQRRIEALDSELGELRGELQAAERALAELLAPPVAGGAMAACGTLADCSVCPGGATADLSGRCLLCVGGRESLVGHYRGLVEGLGGRFLHHDGGIEDNPKQLEATLASADAVVCQAGCVSHAAYWKLKEYCKRTNKPCIYLKRSGVTSFARGVELLARGAAVDAAGNGEGAPLQ
ncbi:MAG: hypothetical protein BGO63_13090 [Candidatus Accumulibacter sp. 66-26]|nr:DUF2325 domain-containing protein [Accumulibacter sp.]OJW52355.1 MAG: hypothetical protein BGO63_13090 [Candidatus Accumulibacter sp. 66-26]